MKYKIIFRLLLFVVLSLNTLILNSQDNPVKQLLNNEHFFCSTDHSSERRISSSRGISTRTNLWDVGQTIRVRFMNGTSKEKNEVKRYVKDLERYANLKFRFLDHGASDIRIKFVEEGSSYSAVGTHSLHRPQDEHTMQFGTYKSNDITERVILHEFGHAIGLWHEHNHPEREFELRPDLEEYLRDLGWPEESISFYVGNVSYTLPKDEVLFCKYDSKSLMHYPVEREHTLNNYEVPFNETLSKQDKEYIQQLYPFNEARNSLDCICSDEDCKDYNLTVKVQSPEQGGVRIVGQSPNNNQYFSDINSSHSEGEIVEIEMITTSGYRFVGWRGTSCNNSTSRRCRVVMNRNHSITAVFEPIANNTLSVQVVGNGSVSISDLDSACRNSCKFNLPERASISVKATPDSGYRFVRWEGDVCNNGTNSSCSLTLVRDLSIRAIFEPNSTSNTDNDLNIKVIGEGAVIVTSTTSTYSCANDCTFSIDENEAIQLTATPVFGYRFIRWEGIICNNGTNSSCSLTLNRDLAIRAIFEPSSTNSNTCRNRDSIALVALYNSTSGPDWVNSWNLYQPMTSWYGVGLNNDGCVAYLDLDGHVEFGRVFIGSGNGLNGTLPDELWNLEELEQLSLSGIIRGKIDEQLLNLKKLRILQISGGSERLLKGYIPSGINQLQNLETIFLVANSLSGELPSAIGELRKLYTLALYNNQFTGDLPLSLGNLRNLNRLSLFGNNFTGNIPPTLGNLTNLSDLYLSDNNLSGCFPEELKALCYSNTDVSFSRNPKLPNGGDFDAFCHSNQGSCADTNTPKNTFIGNWTNTNPNTQSIPYFFLSEACSKLANHSFGKCHPNNCDWGYAFTELSDQGDDMITFIWEQGFAIKYDTLRLINENLIERTTFTHFVDNSGRQNRTIVENFYRSTCSDGIRNGDEMGTDRGGIHCHPETNIPCGSFGNPSSNSFQIANFSPVNTEKLKTLPNYPNPFTFKTTLPILMPKSSKIQLQLFSITGQQIYQEVFELKKGKQLLELDGQLFPKAGIYIYQISDGKDLITGKLNQL